MPTTPDLAAVRARHARAREATNAMLRSLITSSREFQISIPRREDDSDALVHASLADVPALAAAVEERDTLITSLRRDLAELVGENRSLAQHLALAWGLEGTAREAGAVRLLMAAYLCADAHR